MEIRKRLSQQHSKSLAIARKGAEVHVARYIEINSRSVAHHRVSTKQVRFYHSISNLQTSLIWVCLLTVAYLIIPLGLYNNYRRRAKLVNGLGTSWERASCCYSWYHSFELMTLGQKVLSNVLCFVQPTVGTELQNETLIT